MVNPRHFETEYPSNVDDVTIDSKQPELIPTEMTYFLRRAKMSEIFRQLVDVATNTKMEVEQLPYNIVLEFDDKLNKLLENAPACFKMDSASKMQSRAIFAARPYIEAQRDIGQVGLHTRLCRLHRPFLTRGAHDPQYAYSRMVCLRSARTVIAMAGGIMRDYSGFNPQRVWTITHHFFVVSRLLIFLNRLDTSRYLQMNNMC